MGKFAKFVEECKEARIAEAKAKAEEFNKSVDQVKLIFLNPENFQDLQRTSHTIWTLTMKNEEMVSPFIELLQKLRKGQLSFESGHFYKATSGKKTFHIESDEKDIDTIFSQIESALEELKK